MFYNTSIIGDFKKYFDTLQKRNFWVLGYFGGGSVNVADVHQLAQQFSHDVGVPLNSVRFDEILHSSRHKGFKIMFSDAMNQNPETDSDQMKNVYAWLTN